MAGAPTNNYMEKLQLLQLLQKQKVKDRLNVISYTNKEGIDCLCEAIHNVLTSPQVNKLSRKKLQRKLGNAKGKIRYLSNPKHGIVKKKAILREVGGSLGLILSIAVPLLMSLLKK